MRSRYKLINPEYPYFITSTIINWFNIFENEEYSELLYENFIFYQKKYEMIINAFVIMHNHFHMIVQCSKLETAIQSMKSYTARKIIDKLKCNKNENVLRKLRSKRSYKVQSEYQLWQEGYHPEQISNKYILNQKIEYIHQNPVRKGFVSKAEEWVYSSAGFYYLDRISRLKIIKVQ